jgi:hypothetical protein
MVFVRVLSTSFARAPSSQPSLFSTSFWGFVLFVCLFLLLDWRFCGARVRERVW